MVSLNPVGLAPGMPTSPASTPDGEMSGGLAPGLPMPGINDPPVESLSSGSTADNTPAAPNPSTPDRDMINSNRTRESGHDRDAQHGGTA